MKSKRDGQSAPSPPDAAARAARLRGGFSRLSHLSRLHRARRRGDHRRRLRFATACRTASRAQGRTILGGDVSLSLMPSRAAPPDERAFIVARGTHLDRRPSARHGAARRRSVRRSSSQGDRRGLSAASERSRIEPADPAGRGARACADGAFGLIADPALSRDARHQARRQVCHRRAVASSCARCCNRSPTSSRAASASGPRVLISQDALQASGPVQPGSLVRWSNRVSARRGEPGAPSTTPPSTRSRPRPRRRFPEAGWQVRTRANVSPQFEKNLARFTQFLTLVGLTALIVGGVGVANAVRAFIDRKRPISRR